MAARYASGVVVCWELEPLRRWVLARLEGAHWVSTGFSRDSAWLVAGASGHLWACALPRGQDPAGAGMIGTLGVPQRKFEVTGWAGALAFEGESRYLAVVLNAAAARIPDWRDGCVVAEFSDPEGVTCLAWHPDSRQLLTGSQSGAVRVWDTLTASRRALAGHRTWIHGLAVHPRGDLAASQSWDGTTKLWELAADRPLLSTEEGCALEFSSDGQWLVLAGPAGLARWALLVNDNYFSPVGKNSCRSTRSARNQRTVWEGWSWWEIGKASGQTGLTFIAARSAGRGRASG